MLHYKIEIPDKKDLYDLYEALDWNRFLGLDSEKLYSAMKNSWRVVCCYDNNRLVATGRIISDGITNGYICGLGVLKDHRGQGIAAELCKMMIEECQRSGLHIQLLCEEDLVPYYEGLGFSRFTVGMRYLIAK